MGISDNLFKAIVANQDGDTAECETQVSKMSITMAVQNAITCQCKTGCRRVMDARTASLFSFGEDAEHGMIAVCGSCSPRWIQFSQDLSEDKGIGSKVETWLGVQSIGPSTPASDDGQMDIFTN